jgi:hypothetical protein
MVHVCSVIRLGRVTYGSCRGHGCSDICCHFHVNLQKANLINEL